MINVVDKKYFYELAEQDPSKICKRVACKYDHIDKVYKMIFWGNKYSIDPTGKKIKCITNNIQNTHEYFQIFIIHYLLMKDDIKVCNEWISEKDIPGGTTFFRGPHEIPTYLISLRFNNNINEFKERCEQLHGIPLNMADAAYSFKITPRIPVAVLYWRGDDDFPAESKILYDRTIAEHLASDILYALAVGICERLGKPLADKAV